MLAKTKGKRIRVRRATTRTSRNTIVTIPADLWDRILAIIPQIATPYYTPTLSDAMRAVLKRGVPIVEAELRQANGGK